MQPLLRQVVTALLLVGLAAACGTDPDPAEPAGEATAAEATAAEATAGEPTAAEATAAQADADADADRAEDVAREREELAAEHRRAPLQMTTSGEWWAGGGKRAPGM